MAVTPGLDLWHKGDTAGIVSHGLAIWPLIAGAHHDTHLFDARPQSFLHQDRKDGLFVPVSVDQRL